MRWNDLKIGKKMMIGSGSILFLLIVVGAWAFWGLGSVVRDGIEVANGNALRGGVAATEGRSPELGKEGLCLCIRRPRHRVGVGAGLY